MKTYQHDLIEDLYVKESRWHPKLSWSYQPCGIAPSSVSTWQRLTDKMYPLMTTGNDSGFLYGPGMPNNISDQHEKIPLMNGDDQINTCNPVVKNGVNSIDDQPRYNSDYDTNSIRVSAKSVTSYGSSGPAKQTTITNNSTTHHKPDCSIQIDMKATHDVANKHKQSPLDSRLFGDMKEQKRFKRSLAILFFLSIILITGLVSFIIR